MNTSDVFKEFLGNLVIQNKDEISGRYKTITKSLNKKFHNNDSEIVNSLEIGSYGRKTAVNGVSDLDMIFEMAEVDFKNIMLLNLMGN